jgi:hypothetical protein
MGTSCSSPVLSPRVGLKRSPSDKFLPDDDSSAKGTPTRQMGKKMSSRKILYHPNSGVPLEEADEKEPLRRLAAHGSKKNVLPALYSPMTDGDFSPSNFSADKKIVKKRSKCDLIEQERIRMANDMMSPKKVSSRNNLLSPIRIDVRTVNKVELSLDNSVGLSRDHSSNEMKGRYLVEEKLDGPHGMY